MADTEDTKTLGDWLRDWRLAECDHHVPSLDRELCCAPCLRDRLLTSDWLLARDERIRADEREKLAAEVAVVDPRDGEVCCSSGCVEGTAGEGACELAQPLAGEVEAR